ncbi:hypothetical protein K3G39_12505 [Pontibacter sp. HSC-14F20]|uniref:DUF6252 family protein n=1 Tax=Pontibacter sp. HSC-14F20 TaxID=2864136 RepID=UPI001C72AA28|nr:DUF6252 family protein [Pontibacter sp. HSC-14F20]MBX0334060.1 hypothetical protein [Pontibacter sp. HSC-14F20]
MKRLLRLNLLLLIILLSACDKDKLCENEAFCAEIDGKRWWPSSAGDFKSSPLTAKLLYGDSVLAIRASSGSDRIYFSILDGNTITIKNYVLSDTLSRGYYDKSIASDEFETDTDYTGILSINEINKSKKTVAGTFHFKARNSTTGEVADITNGSFNTIYVEY